MHSHTGLGGHVGACIIRIGDIRFLGSCILHLYLHIYLYIHRSMTG